MRGHVSISRIADLLSFWIAVFLAFQLRFQSGLIPIFTSIPEFEFYCYAALVLSPFYLMIMEALGNYEHRYNRLNEYEVRTLYRSLMVFYLFVITLSFFNRDYEVSRITVALSFFITFLLCTLSRLLLTRRQMAQWKRGIGLERVILVGKNQQMLEDVERELRTNLSSGFQLVALRIVDKLPEHLTKADCDRVIVVGSFFDFNEIADFVFRIAEGVTVDLVPAYHIFLRHLPFHDSIGIYPLLPLNRRVLNGLNGFVKRVFDILISFGLLLIVAPLMIIIAIILRLLYGKPVLFRQQRVGQNGLKFTLYKFRTMRLEAAEAIAALVQSKKQPNYKQKDDQFVCGLFARFLRRTSFDELPQLWNVLTGSMSLVGPRPAPVEFVKQYSALHKLRLAVPPGLTGLQQIHCRGTECMEDILKYDMQYLNRQTLWLDIEILFKTIPAVLLGKGIH